MNNEEIMLSQASNFFPNNMRKNTFLNKAKTRKLNHCI